MKARGASADALVALSEQLGTRTLAESATLGEQLLGMVRVLRSEVALRRVLTDSSVEGDAKAGLAESVFSSSVEAKALSLLTDAVRRRWTSGRDLPDALEHLAIVATVHSAGKADGERVGDEFFAIATMIAANPELRSALGTSVRPAEDRNALLSGILGDQVLPATAVLVAQAVSSTEGTVESLLSGFQKVAASALDEIVAVVRTAREAAASDVERLASALGKQYSTTVHLHVVVEPALVGGLRVEIGDDVIDGTVSSRLDDARRRLAG